MAARKAQKRKTVKSKKAKPRKAVKRKRATVSKTSHKKETASNRKAQWDAYKRLEKQIDQAWEKLRNDVKKKASPQILVKDKNHLMLLLGECNYMVRECVRHIGKSAKRK